MCLEATALGLGTTMVGLFDRELTSQILGGKIQPDNEILLCGAVGVWPPALNKTMGCESPTVPAAVISILASARKVFFSFSKTEEVS